MVKQLGQPSLVIQVDRARIARYGLNVADINGLIEAAVGGAPATQVVQGEKLFDLVVRLQPQFRQTPEAIGNILVATPGGQQVPLKELAEIQEENGASFIYRENSSRYIGVQYSVEGRDLASAVEDARRQVEAKVKLPAGYRAVWGGEYEEYTASREQLQLIAAADDRPDLPDPVPALQQLQVPVHHGAGGAPLRPHRRPDRPASSPAHRSPSPPGSASSPSSASRCRPR